MQNFRIIGQPFWEKSKESKQEREQEKQSEEFDVTMTVNYID